MEESGCGLAKGLMTSGFILLVWCFFEILTAVLLAERVLLGKKKQGFQHFKLGARYATWISRDAMMGQL